VGCRVVCLGERKCIASLGEVTILLVYDDDIIVTVDDKREQQMLSQCLKWNLR